MTAPNLAAASSPAGSIYDLGYRHYEGRRRGRVYAMWSLYVESVRGVWGFGRPMSAKAAPFILAGLYALPALFQLAFSAQLAQAIAQGQAPSLFTYHNYFNQIAFFMILFLVAQAPELVCRDQRYTVLPLYFTRALSRFDYAAAKFAALATAIFSALMVPMIALFIGNILMGTDTFKAAGDEWPRALPAIPASALTAASLAAISLALSAFSPRRAYAAIGLVAYFLLMEIVPSVVYTVGQRSDWTWSDKLILLTPTTALSGATDWFFGVDPRGRDFPATLGPEAYVLAVIGLAVVFTGVLLFRYRRIPA